VKNLALLALISIKRELKQHNIADNLAVTVMKRTDCKDARQKN
jgi:hypothetical protein